MSEAFVPLLARRPLSRRVVILTGAGVSVASGLPTYRGAGGLWNADPSLAAKMVKGAPPELVWQTLGAFRGPASAAEPNAAHLAIARYEAALEAEGSTVTVITQNVDRLHTKAGSRRIIELHGTLFRTRCSDDACALEPFDDSVPHLAPPPCPLCGGPLRLDVVLFEEQLPARAEVDAKHAFRDCDLFLAVGTSATVWPAASFVRWADFEGAHTINVDPAPAPRTREAFRETIVGTAEAVLPVLLGLDVCLVLYPGG